MIKVSKTLKKRPEQLLHDKLAMNECPDCGERNKILEGLHVGASVEVKCGACKQRFSMTPVLGIAKRT